MNEREWMFNKLSQECIEVSKEVSKVLEFGPSRHHPSEPFKTNKKRVESELNDLMGVIDKMIGDGYLNYTDIYWPNGRSSKIQKVLESMEIARKAGTLK